MGMYESISVRTNKQVIDELKEKIRLKQGYLKKGDISKHIELAIKDYLDLNFEKFEFEFIDDETGEVIIKELFKTDFFNAVFEALERIQKEKKGVIENWMMKNG